MDYDSPDYECAGNLIWMLSIDSSATLRAIKEEAWTRFAGIDGLVALVKEYASDPTMPRNAPDARRSIEYQVQLGNKLYRETVLAAVATPGLGQFINGMRAMLEHTR